MKKILLFLCSFMFVFAIFISGCSDLSNFTNEAKGIIFNGGDCVIVEDYLFYANGFASDYTDFKDMTDYNNAKQFSYLSRVNLKDFSAEDIYTSSEKVEVVSENDVVGFGKGYIFAYGQQVYFVAPNLHKTNENNNAFKYLTFFKINFDGGGRSEIYTTENEFDTEKGQIVAVEFGKSAYIIVYDGTKLVSLDITNGGKKVNENEVKSVALPKEKDAWDGNLYYTKGEDSENEVYKIKVDGTASKKITADNDVNYTVTFTGRVSNTIYYTLLNQSNNISYSYYANARDISESRMATAGTVFYKPSVSNITKIYGGSSYSRATGIIFTSNGKLLYKNTTENTEPELILDDYSDAKIICNVGTDVYFATTSGLYKVTVGDFDNVTTIVSEMTIKTEMIGYNLSYLDGEVAAMNDIFFYAQRAYSADTEDEDKKDENVYLYRVASGSTEAQIMGKTV